MGHKNCGWVVHICKPIFPCLGLVYTTILYTIHTCNIQGFGAGAQKWTNKKNIKKDQKGYILCKLYILSSDFFEKDVIKARNLCCAFRYVVTYICI